MDRILAREESVGDFPFKVNVNPGLPRELGRQPFQALVQTKIIKNGGTKHLGPVADALQRLLNRVLDVMQIGQELGVCGPNFLIQATQHHANGSKNLAKFIVQVARHIAQRFFLKVDDLPGKMAQLLGLRLQFLRQVMEPLERLAVGLKGVKAGAKSEEKQHANDDQYLAFDFGIDCADFLRRFRLALVVQYEQARDDFRNYGAPALELSLELGPRVCFLAFLGQGKHAISGTPKIRQRAAELSAFVVAGRTVDGKLAFLLACVTHVFPDSIEGRAPIGDVVMRLTQRHVAQGNGEQVSVVLQTQKLQRGFAVSLHHVGLVIFQPAQFVNGVKSENNKYGKDDAKTRPQPSGGRRDGLKQIVFGFVVEHGANPLSGEGRLR